MKGPYKILVVDDEPLTLKLLEATLKRDGYDVETAMSGKQALELFQGDSMQLVILDLALPDMSGEEVCSSIRRSSDVPIIMLTGKGDDESFLTGMQSGADDYIIKPFKSIQLLAKARALIKRYCGDVTEGIIFDEGNLIIYPEEFKASVRNSEVYFTPLEFKVLLTLAKKPGKTFTRVELGKLVFGDEYDPSNRTLDVHIRHIRGKIEQDDSNPKYIITVFRRGYKLDAK